MKSFLNKGGSAPLDPPRLQRALGTARTFHNVAKVEKSYMLYGWGLKP